MNDASRRTRIEPSPACPQQQCGSARRGHPRRTPALEPLVDGSHRRAAHRNRPFLVALAEHPHGLARTVEIVEVEAAQLAHPCTGRIEQLEHDEITQIGRFVRIRRGRAQDGGCLCGPKHFGQPTMRLGRLERASWVGRHVAAAGSPGREDAGRGRPARQRGPARTLGVQPSEPRAQRPDVDLVDALQPKAVGMVEQAAHIAQVCPDRVRGHVPFERQMIAEPLEDLRERLRKFRRRRVGFGHGPYQAAARCLQGQAPPRRSAP